MKYNVTEIPIWKINLKLNRCWFFCSSSVSIFILSTILIIDVNTVIYFLVLASGCGCTSFWRVETSICANCLNDKWWKLLNFMESHRPKLYCVQNGFPQWMCHSNAFVWLLSTIIYWCWRWSISAKRAFNYTWWRISR